MDQNEAGMSRSSSRMAEEVDWRSIFWRAANASSLSTNQTKSRSPVLSSPVDEILSQQCDDIDEPSTQLMDILNKREEGSERD